MAGVYALTAADYGGAVAWVVPTYRNARAPWRFAEAAIAPVANRVRVNRSDHMIEFPSGGRLSVYSAENNASMLGEAFDLVIVDEAARVSEQTYTDVLLPTLADRDGRIMLISTPLGRNWFWVEWMRGQGGHRDIASWTAPSSANPLPNIRKAAELAKERVSERTYRQEWLAEFVEDGGTVFRGVSAAATAKRQSGYEPGHRYVMGVDLARKIDYTVCIVIDVSVSPQSMVAMDRFNQVDWNIQVQRIKALAERFRVDSVVIDQTGVGDPIVQQLQRELAECNTMTRVVGVQLTNAVKAEIVESLSLAFERDMLKILNETVLIDELNSYELERLPSGLIRYSAPPGMHDDCVMSLALAWVGVDSTGGQPADGVIVYDEPVAISPI